MNIDFFKRLLMFVILLLVQVLVLNQIHLFNYATPFLSVYFVVSFMRHYPRWAILIWSFLLGLTIDVFSNTPGIGSASMTLIGFLQPYVLELFVQRDDNADFIPTISSLSFSKYLYLVFILTFVYCFIFFMMETFSFFNWTQWILSVAGSTMLSVILIVVVENMRKR